MRLFFLALVWACSVQWVSGQFTYFNQITGDLYDLEDNSSTNVEVVEDGYVVWGGGIDDGLIFYFVRKYDFLGNIVEENLLAFPGEYLYMGITNSFKHNPYNGEFVMVQGSGMEGMVKGRFLRFDENLELIDSRYYDMYSDFTLDPYFIPKGPYFFGILVEQDAYIVYAEIVYAHSDVGTSHGTFLMKMDFEGNVIWNEVMQTITSPGGNRNREMLPLGNGGYLVAGGGRTSEGTFSTLVNYARITLLDSLGNILSVIDYHDEEEYSSGTFASVVKLLNGEFLTVQAMGYDHDGSNNPYACWTKIRLNKFDVETETFYDTTEYLDNHEIYHGSALKMLATPDGGAVVMGVEYSNVSYLVNAWMMKVDADLNMEWFNKYNYDDCSNCINTIYDFELSPDGGYIMVGKFTNYDIDMRNSTWLLKVDACGEVEWQGCVPMDVGDALNPGERSVVYPNPAVGQINIEPPMNKTIKSYAILDLSGRQVRQGNHSATGVDVSGLSQGLYLLRIEFADGSVETHKVEVAQ